MKNGWQKLFLFGLLTIALIGSTAWPQLANAQGGQARGVTDQRLTDSYQKAMEIVRDKYVVELDDEALTKAAVQGMLKTLDPHSDYMDRKTFQEFNEKQQSQYFGIGATIRTHNRATYILEPFKDSPAARAGLRYGDHIVAIDGQDTSTWANDKVRGLLLGPRGTQVKVSVKRPGVAEPITNTITRGGIYLASIPNYYMVKPNIGYIGLTRNFQATTNQEMRQAIFELKQQGAESFILDLRGNGGGYLEQAIRVTDQFLQRGQKIVSTRGRAGLGFDADEVARQGSTENFPMVVLIDRSSASASEIVAGAIQDHDRGLIVGETSFGKGLVQRIFPVAGGGALTLTIAHYYTPSGRLIQRDYSNGSLFDYYYRRNSGNDAPDANKPRGEERKTDLGRTVYGGGGIEPDVKIEAADTFTPQQGRLYQSLFLFVRELVAGQVAAAPQFKINGLEYDHKLRANEFIVSDDILKAYREFALKFYKENPDYNVTAATVDGNMVWARKQIRFEVLQAAYGLEKAQQGTADLDVQLQRAIQEMPNAADLAQRAWRRNTANMRPSQKQ